MTRERPLTGHVGAFEFLDLKSAFRTVLERGTVALPTDRELTEEALAIEWSVNPARGAIQILGKDLLRKALGRSPDRLDAVVIGLAASMGGIRQPTVRFETISL